MSEVDDSNGCSRENPATTWGHEALIRCSSGFGPAADTCIVAADRSIAVTAPRVRPNRLLEVRPRETFNPFCQCHSI